MISLSDYCLSQFGEKLYKLSLSAGTSCPNRDGRLGSRGCIFCSEGGSGDFAESAALSIDEQIELAKRRVAAKFHGKRYIAYFQSYTGTYASAEYLEPKFTAAAKRGDIAAVSISTRPDCLPDGILHMLSRIQKAKPVWVELGLQTVNPVTVEYIRRGYDTSVYDNAVRVLNGMGIHTVTHMILGLPGESRWDMLATARHIVEAGSGGVKLQLLHVLEGTDLAADYRAGKFSVLSLGEYAELVADCLEVLGPDIVIHRLTGDGPKRILAAPLWSADKKRTVNYINSVLKKRGII